MDLVRFLDKPAAVVGTTGAGKTIVAKLAAETILAAGRRVIIIDPTGAWWGLRAGADGKPAGGFDITIFGGDHADVPITPDGDTGKALALALADREVQAIIDTSDMTGGEKNRFMTPFLENLYAKNRTALHLIVDEADEIAAQKPADGEQRLLGAFDKIVRRGRVHGFRPLMISQRPAVIHKNVLSQIGTLIALKLTSPQDRKAIEDWVRGNADAEQAKAVMTSLPSLQRGEGWVWSPADNVLERTHFPMIKTFDSSRTPEVGEKVVQPALTAVDVDALRALMQEAKTKIEEKPSTPGRSAPSKAELDAAEKRGFDAGVEHGRTLGASAALTAVRNALDDLRIPDIVIDEDVAPHPAIVHSNPPFSTMSPKTRRALNAVVKSATEHLDREVDAAAPVASSDPFLEVALKVWPAKMTWAGLASMCGRKARGGSFNTRKKLLLERGQVREEGDLVVPTNPPKAPAGVSPADLLERNLPKASAEAFAAIRRQPGITAEALAQQLGVVARGGSWNTRMSILRKNGLIDEVGGRLTIKESLA